MVYRSMLAVVDLLAHANANFNRLARKAWIKTERRRRSEGGAAGLLLEDLNCTPALACGDYNDSSSPAPYMCLCCRVSCAVGEFADCATQRTWERECLGAGFRRLLVGESKAVEQTN